MMEFMKTLEMTEASDMKQIENRDFTEIKPVGGTNIQDARSYFDNLFQDIHDEEKEYYTSYEDRLKHDPNETSNLGIWDSERVESKFAQKPDSEASNAAKKKISEYGMDGVERESAELDFSECCEAEVKIDNMTENRENKYSWHECCDTSTMQFQDLGEKKEIPDSSFFDEFRDSESESFLSADQAQTFWDKEFSKKEDSALIYEETYLSEIFGRSQEEFQFDFEIDRDLQKYLEKFSSESWNILDEKQQSEVINELSILLAEKLAIKNPPEMYFFSGALDSCGSYNPNNNMISINRELFFDPGEIVDTIAHETWHVYQHQRALVLENKQDLLYRINFENYISPDPSGDGKYLFFQEYQDQLVEAEARAFASLLREEVV